MAAEQDSELLRRLRLLHVVAYNTQKPADDVGAELLFAMGDILEGKNPDELDLKLIDKKEFLTELANA